MRSDFSGPRIALRALGVLGRDEIGVRAIGAFGGEREELRPCPAITTGAGAAGPASAPALAPSLRDRRAPSRPERSTRARARRRSAYGDTEPQGEPPPRAPPVSAAPALPRRRRARRRSRCRSRRRRSVSSSRSRSGRGQGLAPEDLRQPERVVAQASSSSATAASSGAGRCSVENRRPKRFAMGIILPAPGSGAPAAPSPAGSERRELRNRVGDLEPGCLRFRVDVAQGGAASSWRGRGHDAEDLGSRGWLQTGDAHVPQKAAPIPAA